MRKEHIIYVEIDLHKETHTAVMLDCWNQKLGEITIENKPAQFHKLTRKVSRYVTEEKTPVYGLENAYGYGRTLPDAIPDDKYWTLGKLVNRRDNISVHQQRLKNQLHEQLCMAYPSYKKFFEDIGRPTPLYFFGKYPSPIHLRGKSAEELAGELRPVSHNNCSTKRAERILELVKSDGETCRDCQESRDAVTRGLVEDLEHYRVQMKEVEAAIEAMLPSFNCTLMTMPGIDIATAANLLWKSETLTDSPMPTSWQNSPGSPRELFLSRKREGRVPQTGKPAAPGHLLLPCYPDGADSSQRDGEASRVPGVLFAEAGGRQEQTTGVNLHCQTPGEYRVRNVEEPHRIPGTREKNRGRNCLKSAAGAFIMETNTAGKGYSCSFSVFENQD